jgi:hypothetical protein
MGRGGQIARIFKLRFTLTELESSFWNSMLFHEYIQVRGEAEEIWIIML